MLEKAKDKGGYLNLHQGDLTARLDLEDNYRFAMDKIEKSGAWKRSEEKTTDYIQQDGSSCNVCIYQKCQ